MLRSFAVGNSIRQWENTDQRLIARIALDDQPQDIMAQGKGPAIPGRRDEPAVDCRHHIVCAAGEAVATQAPDGPAQWLADASYRGGLSLHTLRI